MSDIVERLRTDVLWHQRRGNETIAADCSEAADEIERLREELRRSENDASLYKHASEVSSGRLGELVDELRAEVETLRRDAERYRWLLANAVTEDDNGELHIYYWCSFEHYNDVSSSIDADISNADMKEPK